MRKAYAKDEEDKGKKKGGKKEENRRKRRVEKRGKSDEKGLDDGQGEWKKGEEERRGSALVAWLLKTGFHFWQSKGTLKEQRH